MKNISLAFTLFLALTIGVNAQSYNLKYNLNKGQDYRFYQETKMKIVQSLGFIDQEISNEFKGITRFTPVGSEGDNIVLNTSFETMIVSVKSLLFNLDYDSSKPIDPSNQMSKVYSGIIGKNFKMVINPQGKVLRVEGIDKMISDAVNAMGNVQPQMAAMMKKTVSSQFGAEALIGNMGMLLSMYPNASKKVGDKWSTGTKITSGINAELSNTWTLADASNKQWKLKGSGNISTQGGEAVMNGMKVTMNLSGNQDSEFVVSQNDGWFVSGKQKQQVQGVVSMKANAQMPQGMDIPMKVSSSTYLEKR